MTSLEQRAVDLLVDRATEGLTPDLEGELEDLLDRFPELDPEPFERAAAAIELAFTVPVAVMPVELSQRLRRQACGLF